MVRRHTIGFEIGIPNTTVNKSAVDGRVGAGTVVRDTSGVAFSGTGCARCSGTAASPAYVFSEWIGANDQRQWLRFRFNALTLPAVDTDIFRDASSALWQVRLKSTGKLALYFGGTTQVGTDSAATCVAGTWYRVELHMEIGVGAVDAAELRLDGATVASEAGANRLDNWSVFFWYGWATAPGVNADILIDDIALNDSTGTTQNTWPGDGKAVLLTPVSDNARAALWTAGAGGTTNLYDAVDNIPPAGLATETNTSQIEHAGGAAGSTDEYRANMSTYAAAGIGPNDDIVLVQPIFVAGEDIATGAKLISGALIANPAGSYYANTEVTLGANVAAGDWPTGWYTHWLDHIPYPAVDINVGPVLAVRRPETATRVLSVCFMGVYVEYRPVENPPQWSAVRKVADNTQWGAKRMPQDTTFYYTSGGTDVAVTALANDWIVTPWPLPDDGILTQIVAVADDTFLIEYEMLT
jgi:hypothetical protein